MILSFHPCFVGHKNILCAGREPDEADMAAIKDAHAVVLSQGCKDSLYRMAGENCCNVFPNYDARFRYPDKIGQIRLFREKKVSCPQTEIYESVDGYFRHYGKFICRPGVGFPFVFKFNWGGEGDNVFLIRSTSELRNVLQMATEFERTGQKGFLIQQYIPSGNRSLRVVIIGTQMISYWRVQRDSDIFCANIRKGGYIDRDSDPELRHRAMKDLQAFCNTSGINLAGFDFLFSAADGSGEPLFLEINWFFGRTGLGGSDSYYKLLIAEIEKWVRSLGLDCPEQCTGSKGE
ncbi:MAG: RimK family alpha-L-glutamate ligase [Desulfococcaceae bacterium]